MQTQQKNDHIMESPKSSTSKGSQRPRGRRKHHAIVLVKTRSGSSNCAQICQRKQRGKRTGQKSFSEIKLSWALLKTSHYQFQWTTRKRIRLVLPLRVCGSKEGKAIMFSRSPLSLMGSTGKHIFTDNAAVLQIHFPIPLPSSLEHFRIAPLFLPFSVKRISIWCRGHEEHRATLQPARSAKGTEEHPGLQDLGSCGR